MANESWWVFFARRLRRDVSRFSFLLRLRFAVVVLALTSLYFWAAFQGVKQDSHQEIRSLQEQIRGLRRAEAQYREEELAKIQASLNPRDSYAGVKTCEATASAIFTEDREYAACLTEGPPARLDPAKRAGEAGKYELFRRYVDRNESEKYIFAGEETGRIESGNTVLLSYSFSSADDYPFSVSRPYDGSIVVQVDTRLRTLRVLLDTLAIPNKDLFIQGQRYTPNYILWSENEPSPWSPERRFLLLWITHCVGCESIGYMYAYDLRKDALTYLGEPYSSATESGKSRLSIEWFNENTLRFREGRTRARRDEEYVSGYEFLAVQDDLGYRTMNLPQ